MKTVDVYADSVFEFSAHTQTIKNNESIAISGILTVSCRHSFEWLKNGMTKEERRIKV